MSGGRSVSLTAVEGNDGGGREMSVMRTRSSPTSWRSSSTVLSISGFHPFRSTTIRCISSILPTIVEIAAVRSASW